LAGVVVAGVVEVDVPPLLELELELEELAPDVETAVLALLLVGVLIATTGLKGLRATPAC
jgi:hypothetical protein